MRIQLKEWNVKNLTLTSKQGEIVQDNKDNKFQLSFGHALNEENQCEFAIGFKISLDDNLLHLELEMIFMFETDKKLDKEFDKSPFIRINAPAIAFPYIRSYVSNLTLQSGYKPIILPSINFAALNERADQ
jgi:preprotein translocase subunit SecB